MYFGVGRGVVETSGFPLSGYWILTFWGGEKRNGLDVFWYCLKSLYFIIILVKSLYCLRNLKWGKSTDFVLISYFKLFTRFIPWVFPYSTQKKPLIKNVLWGKMGIKFTEVFLNPLDKRRDRFSHLYPQDYTDIINLNKSNLVYINCQFKPIKNHKNHKNHKNSWSIHPIIHISCLV